MLSFWHAKHKLKDLALAMQLDAQLNGVMGEEDETAQDTLMDSLPGAYNVSSSASAKDSDVKTTCVSKGPDGTLTGPMSPEKPPESALAVVEAPTSPSSQASADTPKSQHIPPLLNQTF